ncbi:hypothetical protein [Streptomyces boninensis]|uniref:hypothetical protein n=1 Tax=Streptomyces boninensis TaxID=2039455 RepID=UPI003B20D08B
MPRIPVPTARRGPPPAAAHRPPRPTARRGPPPAAAHRPPRPTARRGGTCGYAGCRRAFDLR